MSNKEMRQLILKLAARLPETPNGNDIASDETSSTMTTRSNSGKKSKQKRQKTTQ